MTPVSVGIVGLGRSGWNMHAAVLNELTDKYHIAAVTDPDPARRQEAEKVFNCLSFSDFDEFLNAATDLIVVASPSHLHKEQTLAALAAKKHVLVEKPFAPTATDVEEMIVAARQNGKLLTVNQNYRFKPHYQTISEVMASGLIGEIVQIKISIHQFSRRWDWQTLKQRNGGILTNHGAHALDWLLLHFEDEDPEVFCHLVSTPLYAGDADSHAKVIIRPKDGPLMDLELTHSNAYPQERYLVMGTQGSLVGSDETLRWKYFNPEHEEKLELEEAPTPNRSYNAENLSFTEETISFDLKPNQDLRHLYDDLYLSLTDGKDLAITPESVHRQIKLIEKCKRSAGWL